MVSDFESSANRIRDSRFYCQLKEQIGKLNDIKSASARDKSRVKYQFQKPTVIILM